MMEGKSKNGILIDTRRVGYERSIPPQHYRFRKHLLASPFTSIACIDRKDTPDNL